MGTTRRITRGLADRQQTASKRLSSNRLLSYIKRHYHLVIQLAIIAVIGGVMLLSKQKPASDELWTSVGGFGGNTVTLDEVSSADIAAKVAVSTELLIADNVRLLADSYDAEVSFASTSEGSYVSKPQIVVTNAKSSRDIQKYVVKAGDTLDSIALQFNVTTDTIRWANDLSGNSVSPGRELTIPPISGIIHTVQAGDTADSLAVRYQANAQQIIAFNDAEVTGLHVGEKIIIPDGRKPAPARAATFYSSSSSAGFAFGTEPLYGSGGYPFGWCTYYAAARGGAPRNWGNANTWDSGARASGWIVSKAPRVGAIAQTDGMSWAGHVGIVDEVSADGTMIKYSDMNGLAGWGRIGYSDWVPASTFQNYLYR